MHSQGKRLSASQFQLNKSSVDVIPTPTHTAYTLGIDYALNLFFESAAPELFFPTTALAADIAWSRQRLPLFRATAGFTHSHHVLTTVVRVATRLKTVVTKKSCVCSATKVEQ